ncbi:energy-coupling factor ABC transporter permease [Peptococcaceae bacterium 1198_IL3148]
MHIPNGFLDPVTATTTAIASGALLVFGWQHIRKEIAAQQPTTLGLVAAFIFAAQMINYSIGHHTSGHLIGATLAAVICGPWAGGILMTMVLAVQSLFFHDGGTLALGANIINMAVIATAVGYSIYCIAYDKTNRTVAMALGCWTSVVAVSAVAALELSISGNGPLTSVFAAMVGWHSLIGIGEAGITILAAHYFFKFSTHTDLQSEVIGHAKN